MTHIEKVELWEKGFAKYIEASTQIGTGRGNAHLNRKLNDGIRMMATADYEGLKDLNLGDWVINRALKNFNFEGLQ